LLGKQITLTTITCDNEITHNVQLGLLRSLFEMVNGAYSDSLQVRTSDKIFGKFCMLALMKNNPTTRMRYEGVFLSSIINLECKREQMIIV